MNPFLVPRLEKLDSQPEAETLLRGLLAQGAVKTFLWTGPKGVGKQTHALAAIRSLFCQSGPDCPGCPTCRQVLSRTHPDLFWVHRDHVWAKDEAERKKTEITVEVIRNLSEKLNRAPFSAPLKVAVIPNAETMNEKAQDTFLKTLEEPPPKSLIILLAEKAGDFRPTVLSRCRTVRFGVLSPAKIEALLVGSHGWEAGKARQAAKASNGSLAEAMRFEDEEWVSFQAKVQSDFDPAMRGPEEAWLQLGGEYEKWEPDFLEETLTATQRKAEVLKAALQIYLSLWSRRLEGAEPVPETLKPFPPFQVLQCLQRHLDLIPTHMPPRMIFDHLFLQLRQGLEKGEIPDGAFMDLAVQI